MSHVKPVTGIARADLDTLIEISQLVQFPGWHALREHYAQKIEEQKKAWGNRVYRGDIPTNTEAAFAAGFWEGVLALLDTPSRAEERIARELANRKDAA